MGRPWSRPVLQKNSSQRKPHELKTTFKVFKNTKITIIIMYIYVNTISQRAGWPNIDHPWPARDRSCPRVAHTRETLETLEILETLEQSRNTRYRGTIGSYTILDGEQNSSWREPSEQYAYEEMNDHLGFEAGGRFIVLYSNLFLCTIVARPSKIQVFWRKGATSWQVGRLQASQLSNHLIQLKKWKQTEIFQSVPRHQL